MAESIVPPPLPQTPPPLPGAAVPPPLPQTPPPLPQTPPPLPKTLPQEFYFLWEKDLLFNDKAEADKVSGNPDAILQQTPNTAADYSLRGKAYAFKGEYDAAASDFKKALEMEPAPFCGGAIDTLTNYAFTSFNKGDYAESIKTADKLIKLKPGFIYGYIIRAYVLSAKSEHEKAIKEWTKIIQKDNTCANWYLWRGSSYWHLGAADRKSSKYFIKAAEDFNKALELKQDFAVAYFFRGQAYIETAPFMQTLDERVNYLKKSITDFTEAASLEPGNGNYIKTLEQAKQLLENVNN